METIISIISTLGFPIACAVAMGWFIWKIYKQSVKREDLLMNEIAENRAINKQAIETLAQYNDRLSHIESDISDIKTSLL